MNILYMKYAVEVANTGSINKASQTLYVACPNLSRMIKDLENDIGISIFKRSSRGMSLTPQGEEFIGHARNILNSVENLENMYKTGQAVKQKFSISVPRASYIADAFINFTNTVQDVPFEVYYQETNLWNAVNNILKAGYKLGIIRYAIGYDRFFKTMLQEKGLRYRVIAEFKYVLIASRKSVLADKEEIHFSDIRPLIEIAHADPFVPSLNFSAVKKEELPDNIEKRIFIFERGSQFGLLQRNPKTFMWVSPIPDETILKYDLIQRECADNIRIYKDVLIYPKEYVLSELDKKFITELQKSKRNFL